MADDGLRRPLLRREDEGLGAEGAGAQEIMGFLRGEGRFDIAHGAFVREVLGGVGLVFGREGADFEAGCGQVQHPRSFRKRSTSSRVGREGCSPSLVAASAPAAQP